MNHFVPKTMTTIAQIAAAIANSLRRPGGMPLVWSSRAPGGRETGAFDSTGTSGVSTVVLAMDLRTFQKDVGVPGDIALRDRAIVFPEPFAHHVREDHAAKGSRETPGIAGDAAQDGLPLHEIDDRLMAAPRSLEDVRAAHCRLGQVNANDVFNPFHGSCQGKTDPNEVGAQIARVVNDAAELVFHRAASDHLREEAFLGAEVPKKRHFVDPGQLGDLPGCGSVTPVIADVDLSRGGQDALASLFRTGLPMRGIHGYASRYLHYLAAFCQSLNYLRVSYLERGLRSETFSDAAHPRPEARVFVRTGRAGIDHDDVAAAVRQRQDAAVMADLVGVARLVGETVAIAQAEREFSTPPLTRQDLEQFRRSSQTTAVEGREQASGVAGRVAVAPGGLGVVDQRLAAGELAANGCSLQADGAAVRRDPTAPQGVDQLIRGDVVGPGDHEVDELADRRAVAFA